MEKIKNEAFKNATQFIDKIAIFLVEISKEEFSWNSLIEIFIKIIDSFLVIF